VGQGHNGVGERLRRLCAQHHALWGGPWAGARLGGLCLVCSTAPFPAPAAFAGLASGPGCSCCPGHTQALSFAPRANTPCYLVRFTRGGGTRLATRRNCSRPVKYKCQVPSGSARFILQAMRPSSARLKRSSTSAPRAPYRLWLRCPPALCPDPGRWRHSAAGCSRVPGRRGTLGQNGNAKGNGSHSEINEIRMCSRIGCLL
jgi:hypothetical protein